MLKRSQRLTSAAFATAFERSRQLRHPLLRLRAHARDDRGGSGTDRLRYINRATFVVPKKLAVAVRRNRLRRQLRDCFRRCVSETPLALQGTDFIFMATPEALQAEFVDLHGAMAQLLRRVDSGKPGTEESSRAPRSS